MDRRADNYIRGILDGSLQYDDPPEAWSDNEVVYNYTEYLPVRRYPDGAPIPTELSQREKAYLLSKWCVDVRKTSQF